jgi:hypothetical protein
MLCYAMLCHAMLCHAMPCYGMLGSARYRLCAGGENRTGGKGWGLFDQESVPGSAQWRRLT